MTLQELISDLLILLPGNEQIEVIIQGEEVFFGKVETICIENEQVIIKSFL